MSTTVKISKRTLLSLEKLRNELKTSSLDRTINLLIRRYRSDVLTSVFGADRGRIRPFKEEDRGEDREHSS